MKRRIRSIFILMTLCILGINVFQGYWLYSTYALHQQQFTRTAVETLLMSLEKQQLADARLLFHKADSGASTLGIMKIENSPPGVAKSGKKSNQVVYRRFNPPGNGPERVFFVEEADAFTSTDTARHRVRMNIITLKDQGVTHPVRQALPADTVANRISQRIMYDWVDAPFHLSRMDSVYRAELQLRNVETRFRLDTLQLKLQQAGSAFGGQPKHEGYPVQLYPVPVNPVRNLFVQASFQQPVPYILRKMSWLLVGSVVLLVLTTGCFLYMLSTILRQKKLSEIKNDFINNMTHELKTPLATVSAAVEAMLSFGALDDARKTQLYLTVSRNELQRLSDLVEKVLHMAVEEKREMSLETESLNSAELIREIVAQHQMKAPKPVEFLVDSSEDPWIRADRMHLGNTINNLIDNAIKYSREQVTIRINSRREPDGWRLSVQDNGIGIPKSYQRAIFDRFFRVPTGDLHQQKGFGLGLSYVRQVVEKHGGHIEVRSEPAHGSEFVLWIPVSQ